MPGEITVAPGLLIAMPQLLDPNFHRSVVLMVEHEEEGSFGLVLNRPSEARVGDLIEALDVPWEGRRDALAFMGGPVQPDTGWILHEHLPELDGLPGTREIVPGLFLSSAPASLRAIAASPPERMRFILGYSGWGPEQLQSELVESVWINSDVESGFIFDTPADLLLEASLRRLGIPLESLAPAEGIH